MENTSTSEPSSALVNSAKSTSSLELSSSASATNDPDQVAGYYFDERGDTHGFIYSNGSFTAQNNSISEVQCGNAQNVNDSERLVGYYFDESGDTHGFIYANGRFTTLDNPASDSRFTVAQSVNEAGQVVGYSRDSSGHLHGFLYSSGSFTTLDDPTAGTQDTLASSISDSGQVFGYYNDESAHKHRFVYSSGSFTTLDDPPSSEQSSDSQSTNASIEAVFCSMDNSEPSHGFLYNKGDFTPLNDHVSSTHLVGSHYMVAPISIKFAQGGSYGNEGIGDFSYLFNHALTTLDDPTPSSLSYGQSISPFGMIAGSFPDIFAFQALLIKPNIWTPTISKTTGDGDTAPAPTVHATQAGTVPVATNPDNTDARSYTPTEAPLTSSGPAVTSVTTSGNGITAGTGDLDVGAVVTLTLHLSEAVSVSGNAPTLLLNDGGIASYAGGSGSDALQFSYIVAAGQNTSDLAVTTVDLNGAIIAASPSTITPGSGESLTDAYGHIFTFGSAYQDGDYHILRDGVPDGAGAALALVNGAVFDNTTSSGWYADSGGQFIYQQTPPVLNSTADLSGAVTNPAGFLHIDTANIHVATGQILDLNAVSVANSSFDNAGTVDVKADISATFDTVGFVNEASGAITVDPAATLFLKNSTFGGGSLSNAGTVEGNSGSNTFNAVEVTNVGNIEANSGIVSITSSSLINNGLLTANGATLAVSGNVTGSGTANIAGTNAVLEFGGTSDQNVAFSTGAQASSLKLDDLPTFSGKIAGFAFGNTIDLANFKFADNPVVTGVTGTGAIGSPTNVTVHEPAETTILHLVNEYLNEFVDNSTAYTLAQDVAQHGTLFELHA